MPNTPAGKGHQNRLPAGGALYHSQLQLKWAVTGLDLVFYLQQQHIKQPYSTILRHIAVVSMLYGHHVCTIVRKHDIS